MAWSARINDHAAQNRAYRVEAVFEGGDHAEVAAAAAKGPEQIAIVLRTRRQKLPLGGHDVERQDVVAREAVLPHQPADATAQGEPGNAGCRDDARRHS